MSVYETVKFQTLSGAATELRAMTLEDAATLRALLRHPQVKPHIVMRPEGGSQPAFMDKLINRMLYAIDPCALHAGIYRPGQQDLVGTVSLQNWNRHEGRAILGYMVDPVWWGCGFATEAVGLLLKYGFQELGLKIVEGRCRGENIGSERVMLKNGLQLERTMPVIASGGDVMKVFKLCYTNETMPL
jgi:ribosomal-protein-alanine N-acetyltransferase